MGIIKNRENRELYPLGLKRCQKCKEIKALSDFSKKKSTWDGLRSTCKVCDKADHDRYRNNPSNRQLESEYKRNYKAQRRQEVSDYNKKYRQENPYIVKAARRNWHLRNREAQNAESRERMKEWIKENPEKHRTNQRRRRAREFGAEGSHTHEEWQMLQGFFEGICPCCGKEAKLTLDHIIPLNLGGTHYLDNLQGLCKQCNSSKQDRAIDYRPAHVRRWAFAEMSFVYVS